MIEIELRRATPDDAARIAEYHEACLRSTFAELIAQGEQVVPNQAVVRDRFVEWFAEGSGFETVVVEVDGAAAAHVTTHEAHLVHLFVEPVHQGRGLGRRLLAIGESAIADAGHDEAELHTRVENTAAVAFYERQGWRRTDQVIRAEEADIAYDELVMTKTLRPS